MIVGRCATASASSASTRPTAARSARSSTRRSWRGTGGCSAGWPRRASPASRWSWAATSTSRPKTPTSGTPRRCHGGTHVSPPERRGLRGALPLGPDRRLSAPARRTRTLHLVGLPRRQLPQELRHAHRSPAGHAPDRRADRVGRDRSRGAQGQADPVRSRAADHRPRRSPGRPLDAGWAGASERIAKRRTR